MLAALLFTTIAVPQMTVRDLALLSLPSSPARLAPSVDPTAPATGLGPDSSGLIDVVSTLAVAAAEPIPNPFRARSGGATRLLQLRVKGVICPANASGRPCCIIGACPYEAGESVNNLTVLKIGADTVEFRAAGVVLAVPVDVPVTIRMPQ
jgi:hypothetical protein